MSKKINKEVKHIKGLNVKSDTYKLGFYFKELPEKRALKQQGSVC